MHLRISFLLLSVCLLVSTGCTRQKTTDELIGDLQSADERDRLVAVRLLPDRKSDAARVIPALIESLKSTSPDARLSAAIGLGTFGEQAKEAIPALQAAQKDADARIRHAAGVALSRIDPNLAANSNAAR